MNVFYIMLLTLKKECLLNIRRPAEWLNPVLFFILVTAVFPIATTADPNTLKIIAPGVIWVAVLLAVLLSLPQLLQQDYYDGSLEQLLITPHPLSALIFAKVFAHWLMLCVPLILIAPVLGAMYHLSGYSIVILSITLLMGTLILNLLGIIIACLTVGLRQQGLLLALILLPFYVPTLIFASSAVLAADSGEKVISQLAILGALLLLISVLSPVMSAQALKIGITYDY